MSAHVEPQKMYGLVEEQLLSQRLSNQGVANSAGMNAIEMQGLSASSKDAL